MKKLIFIALICLTTASGCRKYQEGPTLSLRSRTERAINIWKFLAVTDANGSDVSDDYNNWLFSIDENNTLLIQWYHLGIRVDTYGTWDFDEDKSHLVLEYTNTILESQFPKELAILRLKETNLIVEGEGITFDFTGNS